MILSWRGAARDSLSQWSKGEQEVPNMRLLSLTVIFLLIIILSLKKYMWFSFTVIIFFFTVSKWDQEFLYSGKWDRSSARKGDTGHLLMCLTQVTGAGILYLSLDTLLKCWRPQSPRKKALQHQCVVQSVYVWPFIANWNGICQLFSRVN